MGRTAKTHFLETTDLKAVIEPPKPVKDVWGTKGDPVVYAVRDRPV